jgi:hypothetical protein
MHKWLVVFMLNSLAACNCGNEPRPIDAGAPQADAGMMLIDAGLTQADGGVDSGVVTVTLMASQNPVSSEMPVTLSAMVSGGTPTQVEFWEDTVSRGIDTSAPFAQERTYLQADNGTKQWVARATIEGRLFTSAPLSLTVSIQAAGLYVSPSGNDASPGTLAAPLATVARARTLATTQGQTIWLLDGVYNASNQLSWGGISFSNAVNVRGYDAGAILEGMGPTGLSVGLAFANGGSLRDISIRNFATGVFANGGTLEVRNVGVSNTATPFTARGTATATFSECKVTDVPANGLVVVALIEEMATATWRGGRFENIDVSKPVFFARGNATFIVEDVAITNVAGTAVNAWDNTNVTLRRVQIADAGAGSQLGVARAAIYAGAQNTAPPLITSVTLENTSVVGSRGPGIGLVQSLKAVEQRVTLVDSNLDRNSGAGLEVIGPSTPPDGGFVVTANKTTFNQNGQEGILMTRGFVRLMGGALSNNGQSGLRLTLPLDNTVIARGTRFSSNRGHGLWFNGNSIAALDVGNAMDGGANTFSGVDAGFSGLRLDAPIQGLAVGNTWQPNEQGADGTGQYTSPLTLAGGASGRNGTVVDGGSIVVH